MDKQKKIPRIGSRAMVFHGNALQTSGGLRREDLMKNPQGKIVSKKKSEMAKKENRLEKAGYFTKKGVFGAFRKNPKEVEEVDIEIDEDED